MLSHLTINNYALIENLEIDFSNGFSIITGETGAGKSILLGALSLILGSRADTKVFHNKEKKCVIEGKFYIENYGLINFFEQNNLDYEAYTILRREINNQGKSRAFINDTPVNLALLKSLGNKLVNIHSQNTTLTLNDSNFQLAIIDNFVKHFDVINKYQLEYSKYLKSKILLDSLEEKGKNTKIDNDYFQFLFDELETAKLKIGEQQEIENELEILNNAEEIKSKLFQTSDILLNSENNLLEQLSQINNLLNKLENYHPDLKNISERLKSNYIDLQDISSNIEQFEQNINFNPEQLELLTNRLDLIYHLQQKHRVKTIDELLEIKNKLSENINNISSLEEKIKQLKNQLSEQHKLLSEIAGKISTNRKKVLPSIEKELIKILNNLGMPDAQINIHHELTTDFTRDGNDKVRFLFNANKGGELEEISRIASGGELSRLMLSVKSLISQRNLLPTIIFDEIDSGVSGDIAGKVGNILQKMAKQMQVIAITHIPQIAGKSSSHYLVYKKNENATTKTFIKKLSEEEQINEIAKMLSGEHVSSAAEETARQLIDNE